MPRNVVFAAPFPIETTMRFARAAARLDGVRLLGLVQEAPAGDDARLFHDVVRVGDGLDTQQLVAGARLLEQRHGKLHRVLGILEPLQVQLAEVRRALGVAGTTPETADLFRDKARMKDELRRHGLPCARHRLIRSWQDAEAFVAEVGLPLVLKPPAGMACKATWRVRTLEELRGALLALHAGPDHPALAEEFLRGREFSFETITIAGQVRFTSFSRYYPAPLEVVENPWIKWVVVLPRVVEGPEWSDARALGMGDGFTHMEWFRKADGEAVFGEIGCRPPGAMLVDQMNYTSDIDLFREWARVACWGRFEAATARKYNVAIVFKRARGQGRISRITGLAEFMRQHGEHVVEQGLLPVGTPRRNWKHTLLSDGHILLRHPDWDTTCRLAEAAAADITMYAE